MRVSCGGLRRLLCGMRADVRNENGGSGGSSLLDSVCYAAEMF
jgi:hypothetical protein